MKITLVTLVWWCYWLLCAGAVALSVLKLVHKQWFPGLFLAVIGVAAILMAALYPRALSRLAIPPEAAEAGGRIVMRMSTESLASLLAWAAGFLGAAGVLVLYPDLLWTKWLGYPGAVLALPLSGLMLVIALNQELRRVVADAQGIVVIEGAVTTRALLGNQSRGAPAFPEKVEVESEKVAWSQVGAVKRIESYLEQSGKSTGSHTVFMKREFLILDRGGEELLSLEDPMDPPENFRRFLESIPRWTGVPVQNLRKTTRRGKDIWETR